MLRRRALEVPGRPAYLFLAESGEEAESLTWGELDARARAVGAALASTVPPGERALLLYPPGLELVAAFFGCLYAGVIAVPAYPPRPRRDQPRLRAILGDATPRIALTTAALAEGLDSLAAQLPELAAVPRLATGDLPTTDWEPRIPAPDAPAFLQYTSGSTSLPKGVTVTHANLVHNSGMIQQAFRQDESSVVVGWLPLYHDMGLIGNVLQPLWCGSRCVLMSPVTFLQRPRRWLEAIGRYGGTTSGGPDFAYELCTRKISEAERQGLDLSSWKVAFSGAEPVRTATLARFAAAFGGCGFDRRAFYPCYGLAEATLFVSGGTLGETVRAAEVDAAALERHEAAPATEDAPSRHLVSCGRAWDGQRIAIADPESEAELPAGRVGEIWVTGRSVARGYWNRPEATERDFAAHLGTGEGPFLRTGDLGFVADGELFVTGRLKDLIILRGRNHYPQDLERTAEASHPALRPGGGAAFSIEEEGEERLVLVHEVERRRVEDVEEIAVIAARVRRTIAEEHEVQVAELVLLRPGGLPKTSSGKVQRHACRAGYLAGTLEVVGRSGRGREPMGEAAPGKGDLAGVLELPEERRRAALTEILAERVAALARLGPVKPDPRRSLTELGIDSLSAVELKGAVEEALGVTVPLSELLGGWGIAEVVEWVMASGGTHPAPTPGPRKNQEELAHPLSAGQEALWFLFRVAPESTAYHIAGAVRLLRPVAPEQLRQAFQILVDRHPALRTTFAQGPDGPVQRIHPRSEVAFVEEDASGWSEEEVRQRLHKEAFRSFDLEAGPVFRAALFRRAEGSDLLVVAVHHIVSDFWSMAVLVRELGVLCGHEPDLPPPGVTFAEVVRRQAERLAGPEGERLWGYWRERLSGVPPLELPTDRPRPPAQTWRGLTRTLRLGRETATGVRELARGAGSTLFVALLAGFQAFLGRMSGQEDFVVGSPTTGRAAGPWGSRLGGVIGYFVNPVALRADLSGDPAVREWLGRVRSGALGAFDHQDYPLALLAERLQPERDPGRPPLVQAMLALERSPLPDLDALAAFALGEEGVRLTVGGLELESVALEPPGAQLDLTLFAAEMGEDLVLSLQVNADLFDSSTAERLLGHLGNLLCAMAAEPDRRLSDLEILGEAERRQLVVEWNRTRTGYPRDARIEQLFAEQAAAVPERIAVVDGDLQVSYGELRARAGRLAGDLRRRGLGAEAPVGVALERSAAMVIAYLGILEAGGAYVPLDPTYPPERLALLAEEVGLAVVLDEAMVEEAASPSPTMEEAAPTSPRHPEGSPSDPKDLGGGAFPPPGPSPRGARLRMTEGEGGEAGSIEAPGTLAYVMFTSGSTGRPKAVGVEHRGVVRLVRDTDYAAFGPEQVFLQLANPSFDAATLEIWGPLLNGGRLVLFCGRAPSLVELEDALARHGITTLWLTAGLFHQVAESRIGALRPLSQLLAGGDVLLPGAVSRVLAELPGLALINGYGPTENTTFTCCHRICEAPLAGTGVPIGRPIANTRAHVLEPGLRPAPVGVAGELFAGGDGLARGYLGRLELTAERFVPSPFCGEGGDEPGARLYRTGDRARRRPDGAIDFLGRLDRQVKIRGFRVEPGEVEAALAHHATVRAAAVLVQGGPADRRLIACVASDRTPLPTPAELRAFLEERLPESLIPGAFVVLSELPLTANGKVDRQALARLAPTTPAGGEGFVAPRTPTEEALAALWARLLGLEQVGVEDDFFDLGGHSLLVTRLAARLEETFGAELPLSALLENRTVAKLAAVLDARQGTAAPPPLHRVPREGDLPLSFAQERLWVLDRLSPGLAVYAVPAGLRLLGPLRPDLLEAALAEVIRRHEALRAVFAVSGQSGGHPVQRLRPAGGFVLPRVDLGALGEAGEEAVRIARREAARPFDLERGPLLRATLLRLAPEEHLLVLVMHHIVADGWSAAILLDELTALYEESPLPEPAVQAVDWAVWQREWMAGDALEASLAFWRRRLAGIPDLELPADRPRPARKSFRGGIRRAALPLDLTRGVRRLGREQGATPFMALLTAFAALLERYTGIETPAVGSPVANRRRAEVERLIGFFVNTLVLPVDLAGSPSFLGALARAREVCLGAYAHQDLPFEKVVEELRPERGDGRNPLFQVSFALEEPLAQRQVAGVDFIPLRLENGTAKFDLTLTLVPDGEELLALAEYDADLFDPQTVDRLLGHFQTLLSGIVAAPEAPLGELPLVGEAERHQLLLAWNDTAAPGPDLGIYPAFAAVAARLPDRIAVELEGLALTYGGLAARAERLALRLATAGAGPEDIIGLCADRSPGMVTAILGVLAAGAAYLPLEPSQPEERLALVARDAGVRWLLASPARRELAGRLAPGAVVLDLAEALSPKVILNRAPRGEGPGGGKSQPGSGLQLPSPLPGPSGRLGSPQDDGRREQRAAQPLQGLSGPFSQEPPGEALAYVLYTSGSTGAPKGVMVSRRALSSYLGWASRAYGVEAGGRVPVHSPLGFDLTVTSLFLPLLAGATVVLLPEETGVEGLLDVLRRDAFDLLKLTPAHLAYLGETLSGADLAGRAGVLVVGGEALLAPAVAAWRSRETGPGRRARIVNEYGPTEATVGCSIYEVSPRDDEAASIPIGRPVANARLHLLDRELRPVPAGVPGEVAIGGAGLARGYLGRPDLTAERFIPDPFGGPGEVLYRTGDLARRRPDGVLEYLGRADRQVKVRGYRIELAEVEAAIAAHPDVVRAVAAGLPEAPGTIGGTRLVAWVVPREREELPEGLPGFLAARLPAAMIPSAWRAVPELPLTANGKVDLARLPEPEAVASFLDFAAPRSATEQAVAEIWCEVLGLERAGLGQSFFDLGGHSLLAARVLARVEERFGVELPMRELFGAPTIEALAERVEEALVEAAEASRVDELLDLLEAGEGAEDLDALLAALEGGARPAPG